MVWGSEEDRGNLRQDPPGQRGSTRRHGPAAAPGYDRTRSIEGEFSRGSESSLNVDSGRGLSLSWRGARAEATAAAPAGPSSSWFRYAGSILLTIFGSIVSASIGVLVQDFLRSRKARLNETGPVRPQRPTIAS